MTRRRHTTRTEDTAFLLQRYAEATRKWTVGERCLSYNMRVVTTVRRIDGDIIFLANGEHMHRSHMRVPPKETK